MIQEGQYRGDWIYLQNCHLAPDWLSELEGIIEKQQKEKPDRYYRMWLTSQESQSFPSQILQTSIKITFELSRGLQNNMKRLYS